MTHSKYRPMASVGLIANTGPVIVVSDGEEPRPLAPRHDLRNASPTGFAWGYGGSGPCQLAIALLAHALADDERAIQLHQQFKWQVVAGLKGGDWELTREQILDWVRDLEGDAHAVS